MLLVSHLGQDLSMASQTDTFRAIDVDHSGLISAEELKRAYD